MCTGAKVPFFSPTPTLKSHVPLCKLGKASWRALALAVLLLCNTFSGHKLRDKDIRHRDQALQGTKRAASQVCAAAAASLAAEQRRQRDAALPNSYSAKVLPQLDYRQRGGVREAQAAIHPPQHQAGPSAVVGPHVGLSPPGASILSVSAAADRPGAVWSAPDALPSWPLG